MSPNMYKTLLKGYKLIPKGIVLLLFGRVLDININLLLIIRYNIGH